jgi:DNA-binding SARP family transcriptional activator/tetratricopeptide (TPR) repeat protein
MSCRLTLLGPPQLLDEQGRLIPIPAKAFALAAYILLTSGGTPTSRAALRQFLWENSDTKTAATNLRKFLLRIRQAQKQFGFELIHEDRDHVRLAKSVEIDLAEFQKNTGMLDPNDLAKLCDLYRGELLEGCAWDEPDVREWLEVQRARLKDSFVSVVSDWLEAPVPSADRMCLRLAARRLIEVEPYNETGHRTLMRLFAEDGEPARVRDVYRSLEQCLRNDLNTEPHAATTELFHSLTPARPSPAPATQHDRQRARPDPDSKGTPSIITDDSHPDPSVAPAKSGAPKVTVLPPSTIGGQDVGHQIIGSLIDDVTIGLCRFRSLSVVAPHTAWELTASGKKGLFSSFGIDYVVETQMQNRGGELWLSIRLLEASTRRILWTEQYEVDRAQTSQQYRRLSVQILTSLVDTIERSELACYDSEQDPTAYHLYLAGQNYLRTLDLPHLRRARRAFKSALNTCPDFVPTLSGLARTLRLEWVLLARGESELLVEAKKLANRAIELDPDDARGYRELGACNLYVGRFDESLRALEQAELRNPQFADLLVDSADALTHACEPQAALEKVALAIDLNPLCPDFYWWVAGGSNFHLHRYVEAVECMSRMRDQTPAYRLLAASWARLGEREQAAEYVHRVMEIHPDFRVSNWLSILPIRDPQYERDYEQGLREAGFE